VNWPITVGKTLRTIERSRAINSAMWFQRLRGRRRAIPAHAACVVVVVGAAGAPLLYYGDEYGQWEARPNNRVMFRQEADLNSFERSTLAVTRSLGSARQAVPALRRGEYMSLNVTDDTLVFGRKVASGDAALVGITRSSSPQQVDGRGHDAFG